jgi:hypothetical protein
MLPFLAGAAPLFASFNCTPLDGHGQTVKASIGLSTPACFLFTVESGHAVEIVT